MKRCCVSRLSAAAAVLAGIAGVVASGGCAKSPYASDWEPREEGPPSQSARLVDDGLDHFRGEVDWERRRSIYRQALETVPSSQTPIRDQWDESRKAWRDLAGAVRGDADRGKD